ncbi:MAG: DUF6326 family protein [Pseudoalteromonas sp.]
MLSVLWIFLSVNYIYCDIFSPHHDHAETLQAFLTYKIAGRTLSHVFE